jgi:hypothetical protein
MLMLALSRLLSCHVKVKLRSHCFQMERRRRLPKPPRESPAEENLASNASWKMLQLLSQNAVMTQPDRPVSTVALTKDDMGFTQKLSLAKGKAESHGRPQRYPNDTRPATGKA